MDTVSLTISKARCFVLHEGLTSFLLLVGRDPVEPRRLSTLFAPSLPLLVRRMLRFRRKRRLARNDLPSAALANERISHPHLAFDRFSGRLVRSFGRDQTGHDGSLAVELHLHSRRLKLLVAKRSFPQIRDFLLLVRDPSSRIRLDVIATEDRCQFFRIPRQVGIRPLVLDRATPARRRSLPNQRPPLAKPVMR